MRVIRRTSDMSVRERAVCQRTTTASSGRSGIKCQGTGVSAPSLLRGVMRSHE